MKLNETQEKAVNDALHIPVTMDFGILVTALATMYTLAYHDENAKNPTAFNEDGSPKAAFMDVATTKAASCIKTMMQKGVIRC